MIKRLLNILFVCVVMLALVSGLIKTLCFPDEINEYENRYAAQVEPLTLSSLLDGSFQSKMEAALSDQVFLSSSCKSLYNAVRSAFRNALLDPILRHASYYYVSLTDTVHVFGGSHLVYSSYVLDDLKESLAATASSHNEMIAAHPVTDFYFYYIEKDADINFETGEQVQAYQYFREQLNVPAENVGHLPIPDFPTYRDNFYRTDHHWNHAGSYSGYLDLLELLEIAEPALEPMSTAIIDDFSGSKAIQAAATTYLEPFSAYQFAFPDMTITINGQPAQDYGNQEAFFAGACELPLTYGNFYGGDSGEVILDTGTTDRGNILIIGESHDNAILKLVASHYDRTHAIDLRNYTHYMGSEFQLTSYLKQHEIDTVLFIGSIGFYTAETFRLGG